MQANSKRSRFVVALNSEGRRQHLGQELLRVLEADERVSILEGGGRNAVTVMMSTQVSHELSGKLKFATVAPAQDLQLLG
jgi:hypothetical protein